MFISLAHASETGAEAAAGNPVLSMLPLLLIILVFYFMVIRPQTKRIEAHRKVIAELNKGDKIVTAGGIIGTISKVVNDEEVRIKIADGIEVTVVRATIMMRRDS
ncbi:MAG: preprotein translocase subunit YajC [Alphaproteobacteria bacterium]|nr:preprotein translocase subunit YajC [Alphaproteobacteria bacterium]